MYAEAEQCAKKYYSRSVVPTVQFEGMPLGLLSKKYE